MNFSATQPQTMAMITNRRSLIQSTSNARLKQKRMTNSKRPQESSPRTKIPKVTAMAKSVILDGSGNPAEKTESKEMMKRQAGIFAKSFASYQRQLGMQALGVDPNVVAQNPMESHSWVYAAAMVQALGIGGVPFGVFRETEDEINNRRRMAKRAGREFKLQRGSKRHSWVKYIKAPSRKRGFMTKALEPDFDNPVQVLLDNPNPLMSGSQLFQATTIFVALLGEGFWIKTGVNGSPWVPGTVPDELWLIPPTMIREVIRGNQLVGWAVNIPVGLPIAQAGTIVLFRLDEVIHFKYIDPTRPYRGLAPITAAARGISLDLATSQVNYSTVINGNNSGGLLSTEQWFDEAQREEIQTWWEEQHSGINNGGTTPVAFGGLDFKATGLSPRDMEYLESRRWNRDEVLSVFGVTKASVGVTDDLNFATQLSQDRNLWTKRLLPLMMLMEAEINKQLLGGDTDDIVGMFQTQGVDALRLGMEEEVNIALKLTDSKLHMPPRIALELSGLEVPEYEGNDVALVPAGLLPAKEVVNFSLDDLQSNTPAPAQENSIDDIETKGGAPAVHGQRRKQQGGKIWQQLMVSIEIPTETKFSRDWRKWVRTDKALALEKFDNAVGLASLAAGKRSLDYGLKLTEQQFIEVLIKAEPTDVPERGEYTAEEVLLDLKPSQNRLRAFTRATLLGAGEATFDFTVNELGGPQVVTVGYDDPRIQRVLELTERRLVGTSPETLQRNLRKSLSVGLQNGETLGQLRSRVAEQYDKFATASKTLQVARTETATMMNSVRESMFDIQGILEREWVTAGDENVRPDHVHFGGLGPQRESFNYLTSVGKDGTLEYPSDLRGPADQVINCRCTHIAV